MIPTKIYAALLMGGALVLGFTPTAHANTDMMPDRGPRIRLALDTGGGVAFGDTRGGAFTINGQLGIQFNDVVGLYYQPGVYINGWASENDLVEFFTFSSNLAMLDFTMARWFQLGFGGGVDAGAFSLCADGGPGNSDICIKRSREAHGAAEGRLAMIIPFPGVRARWGLPLTFRFHSTFFDSNEQIFSATLSVGLIRY